MGNKKRVVTVDTEYEGKVLSAIQTEDAHNLYDLTVRMKQLATEIKGYDNQGSNAASELANTTLEFLKLAGWSRS